MKVTSFSSFVGLLSIATTAGFTLLLWRSWWFFPFWELLIVPLGAPKIDFWQFAALLMFLGTYKSTADLPTAKSPDAVEPKLTDYVAWWIASMLMVPMGYVVLRAFTGY